MTDSIENGWFMVILDIILLLAAKRSISFIKKTALYSTPNKERWMKFRGMRFREISLSFQPWFVPVLSERRTFFAYLLTSNVVEPKPEPVYPECEPEQQREASALVPAPTAPVPVLIFKNKTED
jgi:hypothetical protein